MGVHSRVIAGVGHTPFTRFCSGFKAQVHLFRVTRTPDHALQGDAYSWPATIGVRWYTNNCHLCLQAPNVYKTVQGAGRAKKEMLHCHPL